MRVIAYGRPGNGGLGFLAQGFESLGHTIEWHEDRGAYKKNYVVPNSDVALTDGLRAPMNLMRDEYTAQGKPVLVTDLGFLRAGKGHLQCGLNGLNWMPDFWCPPDRFYSLGLEMKPRKTGDYIVIAGQKGYDAQHYMSHDRLTGMYQYWVDQIRSKTDRPIIFRPHPKSYDMRLNGVEHDIPTDHKNGGLPELLENAHCLVAFNSTACTEAILAGVPVFCDRSAQAAPLGNIGFGDIEDPYFPDDDTRLDHFSRVAYAQWTGAELSSAEVVQWYIDNVLSKMERAA